jgi:fructose-1,6-bisphosphatase I
VNHSDESCLTLSHFIAWIRFWPSWTSHGILEKTFPNRYIEMTCSDLWNNSSDPDKLRNLEPPIDRDLLTSYATPHKVQLGFLMRSAMKTRPPSLASDRPQLLTLQQHVLQEQRRLAPDATGEFSWLLSGVTLATKMIQAKIRQAGLLDLLGNVGEINVQGEVQQKLDVYANRALVSSLGSRGNAAFLVSEENESPVELQAPSSGSKYIVVFDPLDGSSNIDVNAPVGTIFSVFRVPTHSQTPEDCLLQPGSNQVAAGYVLYGTSTVLVYTTVGSGVHSFTLDPTIGAYLLTHENIVMPHKGPYYSTNEAYSSHFPIAYQRYLDRLRAAGYSSRYIGSLVADFHRTLLKGGVFLYPPTKKAPEGKLRLMYEANPLAFIAERAGGRASNGTQTITEILPQTIHQRTPLVIGGKHEMELFAECIRQEAGI